MHCFLKGKKYGKNKNSSENANQIKNQMKCNDFQNFGIRKKEKKKKIHPMQKKKQLQIRYVKSKIQSMIFDLGGKFNLIETRHFNFSFKVTHFLPFNIT